MAGVEILGAMDERVLTEDALAFVAGLHREFDPRATGAARAARAERQAELERRSSPGLPAGDPAGAGGPGLAGRAVPPRDLWDRRVEITGPVDRKMMINALNSGAKVFMADFEDANSPTWENCVDGPGST